MDNWGVWYEAIVMERDTKQGILVHYVGWKHSWDEWFQEKKRFHIAPLHTFTPPWKEQIQEGHIIEHKISNMWYETVCIEKKDTFIRLQRIADNKIIDIENIYQDNTICPMGFHLYFFQTKCDLHQRYRKKYCLYNISLLPRNGSDSLYIILSLLEKRMRLQEHV
jgi:hypothetical protein